MKLLLLIGSLLTMNFYPIDRYKKLSSVTHSESEIDSAGNYSCLITINLFPLDSIAQPFSKDIKVINNNSQTGYEVDSIRDFEVEKFMQKINK